MGYSKSVSLLHLVRVGALTILGACCGGASPLDPGCPIIAGFSTREIGGDAACWNAIQSRDGRLLVGSDGLTVFDGSSWRTFPIPGSYCLRALAQGSDGRIWAGAINEVGYFTSDRGGPFQYHSLVSKLPANIGPLGNVWYVFLDGKRVVYITNDRVLCWDGNQFEVTDLGGTRRLLAFQANGRIYVHHVLTGLYEIENGELKKIIPADLLKDPAVFWLEKRGDGGLLLGTAAGFFVFQNNILTPFAPEASAYIRENYLTSVVRLPDRTLVAGTFNGGLVAISNSGALVRVLSTAEGLPSRAVYSMFLDRQENLWVTSRNYVSRIDLSAPATIFDSRTGLAGKSAYAMYGADSSLTVSTDSGLFHIENPIAPTAKFTADLRTHQQYWSIVKVGDRVLGGRFRGIDDLTGEHVTELSKAKDEVFCFGTVPEERNKFWVADGFDISEIQLADDTPVRQRILSTLPDSATSLCIGPDGIIWAGTLTKGLFRVDAKSGSGYTAVSLDPSEDSRNELNQGVTVARVGSNIIAFGAAGGFVLRPGKSEFERIAAFPKVKVKAVAGLANGSSAFVAFEENRIDGAKFGGLGVIEDAGSPEAIWREFDLPSLATIGSIRSMALNGPSKSPLLWVGGTEGVLRVEPKRLIAVQPPPPPIIDQFRLLGRDSVTQENSDPPPLPYNSKFAIYFSTPDFRHHQQLLYQYRVIGQSDEWSVPAQRSMKEFSYLWEGNYIFEVRTVGESGMTSQPVSLHFRVLPPWHRSPLALIAYLGLLIGGLTGVVRWRHRAVLATNRELGRLVRERTAELERTSMAKDEFVASISHEIRNPLNGLIGLSAALDASELGPSQRHQLSMMRQCADHLASLIEDILDFSKIEAGEIAIESKPFDVQELLESIRSVVYDQSISSGIPIDLVVEGSVPPVLIGDKHRIRQVLLNYVSNALKYAGRGRVTVSVHAAPASPAKYEVTFTVADEGPGIPSAEQILLFTKFKRGSAARARNLGGAGLGLAVCRSLAEKMGGSTMVHSEVGSGAFFYLRLPLASPPDMVALPSEPAQLGFSLKAPALVVEDQEFNAAGLVAMLQKMGVSADVASSGEEALQKLAKKDYILIFSDCDLPGMSGIEMTKAIRRSEKPGERTIIIATTAYATRQIVEECQAAGMDGFVGKPITLEKLRLAIAETLDTRRTAPSVRFAAAEIAEPKAYSLETLRYIANEDNSELKRRLDSYVRELDGYLVEIGGAARCADFNAIRKTAHKLVAHLAVVEHERLCSLAQQIEEASINRNLPELNAKLTELKSGARGFRRHLLTVSESVRS